MSAPAGYTKLGTVGYSDKGAYDSTATYMKFNTVTYNGGVYACKVDNTTGVVPTNTTNWTCMIPPSTGGHDIENAAGTVMTQRQGLQFTDADVTDDPTNNRTVVTGKTMTGATAQAAGTAGKAPAPAAGDQGKFLRGDGTWQNVNTNPDAADVSYDNTTSGATETNLQTLSDTMYKRIQILFNPYSYDPVAYKNAAGNRGKDITAYWKDGSLWKRIAGTDGFDKMEDLYLWDFITLDATISTGTGGGSDEIRIGEFSPLNNYQLNGQTSMSGFFEHLLMVPTTHFGTHGMNSGNTTAKDSGVSWSEEAYIGSRMNKEVLGPAISAGSASGTINEQLYAELGAHLKTTKELLTNAMNASAAGRLPGSTGASANWTWQDTQAVLMSELEVYGSIVWSSSGYDTGNAKKQIAAFMYDEYAMFPQGVYFWLKDVVSSAYFARANGHNGVADCNDASAAYYVRPRFIIA